MEYTYASLKEKTIAELREIAKGIEHEAVQGVSQLNKDHALVAICTALGIDTREHHVAVGIDKTGIKTRIKDLKKQRAELTEAKNYDKLSIVRRRIHHLKHALRKSMA